MTDMKQRTKTQKLDDQYIAYQAMLAGEKPKRSTRKDGSLPTKPIVPCEDLHESAVLQDCLYWLRNHRFIADRMNTGAGDFGGGFRHYGIIGAGDILAYAPNGRGIEIECKAGKGGTWGRTQQIRCKRIRKNNVVYMIVHGVEELEYRFKQEGLI